MILTFLGENSIDREKIFPTVIYASTAERAFSYHIDLLMYTKALRDENAKLRKRQIRYDEKVATAAAQATTKLKPA